MNQNLRVSHAGENAMRAREGVVHHYYDRDGGRNCTYGIGTLVHPGPCTAEELRRHVTEAQINEPFHARTETAARAVRSAVTQTPLTQEQFDALVSLTYNLGARGARNVLADVNRGDFHRATQRMMQATGVVHRDAHGNPVTGADGHVLMDHPPGLVNRRAAESAPFRNQPQGPRR